MKYSQHYGKYVCDCGCPNHNGCSVTYKNLSKILENYTVSEILAYLDYAINIKNRLDEINGRF